MSYKSRGNYKFSKCIEGCECRSCRADKSFNRYFKVVDDSKTTTSSSAPFLVVEKVCCSDNDGSRFDKPLSRAYLKDLQQRKYTGNKKRLPSSYGA